MGDDLHDDSSQLSQQKFELSFELSIEISKAEAQCRTILRQIAAELNQLESRLIETEDLREQMSLYFDIEQYDARKQIVENIQKKLHQKRDQYDREYFDYILNSHPNAEAIEIVAFYYGLEPKDLKNSAHFLKLRKDKRLFTIAKSAVLSSRRRKRQGEERKKAEEQLADLEKLKAEKAILEEELASVYAFMNEQQAETAELRQRVQEKNRLKTYINQAVQVWLNQQQTVRQQEKVFADERYGLLLAVGVQEMERRYEAEKIPRDEHTLRTLLEEELQQSDRDYFSNRSRNIVRHCNLYLLGKHSQQSQIDSVLHEEAPLEEIVLAFDPESRSWWWLRYIHLQIQTGNPDSNIVEIRRHLRKNDGVEHNPSYDEFSALYEIDPELRELIISLFDQSLDKTKMPELNVN